MSCEVRISSQADDDLRGIFEYIAYELRSFSNAAKQLERLEKEILSLDEMPERFGIYRTEPWQSRMLRIMPVDNYLVFYTVDHHAQIVYIIRVMYGKRDINAHLGKIPR